MSLAEFLPYMEETGLSIPVGMMLLRKACQHLQTLAKSGFDRISIHVPLSAKQFAYPNLLKEIEQLLAGLSLNPELLNLEIRESALSQHANAAEIIKQLRNRQLRVSIDKFGTESASLKNLYQIIVDNINIDRTLLESMAVNYRNAEIVAAIIKLAKSINTTVTATGIEKQAEIAYLREFGCQYVQGPLCSPALDATAVLTLLSRQQPVLSQ
jgi:EAL domain-containing protein (putative c-di-GMP-specific phosphodiesterase class I)